MQLGMIGLGRMGSPMVLRLMRGGHTCVVLARRQGAADELVREGARGVGSYADLAAQLDVPRVVWMMVPAGVVGDVLAELVPHLSAGDVVVDGGNSHFVEDLTRARDVAEHGVHYVDCGVSGGVWGLENGYGLMVGGAPEPVAVIEPLLRTLAPGLDAAPRTPGREGAPAPEEEGWLHCGPVGAGHFVKMVHNGIEYGLMEAYAEGLNLLRHANAGAARGRARRRDDADERPRPLSLRDRRREGRGGLAARHRRAQLAARPRRRRAARGSGARAVLGPRVGFRRGALDRARRDRTGVPAPVLTAALFARFSSRGEDEDAHRLLSAMRAQFGGHAERLAEQATDEHRSPGALGGAG